MATILRKKNFQEHSLEQVHYEQQTLTNEMRELSDIDLYDRCLYEIQLQQRHDLDQLYDKLAEGKPLTKDERKIVEAFYVLSFAEFMVKE